MELTQDDSLQTRRSLLTRLRDRDDARSWQTFFDLYWRLLYNVARRAGLSDADAQDVVQDTVADAARQMPRFRYDPARGSFKHWLFRILKRRISDHFRAIYRQPAIAAEGPDDLRSLDEAGDLRDDGVERGLGAAWDQEWERSILAAAVAEVRVRANPKHFQVFDCCVLKEWAIPKVAATLGLNAAQVYLARHRVSQAVKRAARRIREERSRGQLT